MKKLLLLLPLLAACTNTHTPPAPLTCAQAQAELARLHAPTTPADAARIAALQQACP